MKFMKNEDAVSPVIGVILMVAITVILAAVIAAFVFGMAGNIQKTKVVAATASQSDATHITITYQGGQDAGTVDAINITVNGAGLTAGSQPFIMGTAVGNAFVPVGCTTTFNTGTTGKDNVVVTAHFTDGSSQVILDTSV